MAKKSTAVAAGVGLLALGGLLLLARSASAADDKGQPGGGKDAPDWPVPGGGEPGNGPGGVPKPYDGGETYGDPGTGGYSVPEDWDPIRGLYISPDCEMVVEAPGWYCGAGGPDLETPQIYGGFACTAIPEASYVDTMAQPGNGVAGYVYFLIELGMQPEDIAYQILSEVSAFCADLPDNMWPEGLVAWYDTLLERVILDWESEWGIPFDPEAA